MSIDRYNHHYCSQFRGPPADIKSITEGVLAIVEILKRTILCRHDVKEISRIYQVIVHFEKQKGLQIKSGFASLPNPIPPNASEQSSIVVLDIIIEKIQKIAEEKNIAGLISLFHLQDFSDQDLQIKNHFAALWNFSKDKHMIKHIATCMPCCGLKTDFKQDKDSLIGSNQDQEVIDILALKRRMQKIGFRKLELYARREDKLHHYPKYLNELLDGGYIHLYDHLIKMILNPAGSDSIIDKMTCSEFAFVVLETRDAIIKKVEKSFTQIDGQVLLLLGNKKAGKSTTLCFLRGDKMEEVCERYESDLEPSTLLPNITVTQNGLIIDYPSFDHQYGEVISLGIECALKALIKKYDAKCLVLESILEQSRFDSTSKLAARLERILNNKSHCLLGITKYAQDPHYKQIKRLEEEAKESRSQPTTEENILARRIKNTPSEIRKKELQLQLDKLREERLSKPSTETEHDRKELEKKENQLLKESQLVKSIKLDTLIDPEMGTLCSKELFASESISLKPNPHLDETIKKHLSEEFKKKLKHELETGKEYQVKFEDFDDFENKVKETSLINAFLLESNPEIGAFLHLEEMDSTIVRDFDLTISDSCTDICIRTVMCEVNVSLIRKLLIDVKAEDAKKYTELKELLHRFTNYILDLQQIAHDNDAEAEKAYNTIRDKYIAAAKEAGKDYEYPTWATILFLGINLIPKWRAESVAKQKTILESANEQHNKLKTTFELLTKLKKIQILTKNNSDVEKALNSEVISSDSVDDLLDSLKRKIRKVRAAYGGDHWDTHVSSLLSHFTVTAYEPGKKSHLSYLLAKACSIVIPTITSKTEKISIFQNEDAVLENGTIVIRYKSLPDLQSSKSLENENSSLNKLMLAAALLMFHDNASKK